MFAFRIQEVPVFEIGVVQGLDERIFDEAKAVAICRATDQRPTLVCQGCQSSVYPTHLFNLNRCYTDGALHVYCRDCVSAAADARSIPMTAQRWYRLTDTIEHALRVFEEKVRGPVIAHNRRVELQQEAAAEREQLLQRKLAKAALVAVRPLCHQQPCGVRQDRRRPSGAAERLVRSQDGLATATTSTTREGRGMSY